MEQNRESTNKPYQLIFDKGTKVSHWGKKSLQMMLTAKNGGSTCNPYFVPYTKTNSKWTIDLTVNVKTMNYKTS